jgi:polyhydroxyalkanoate synthase subunit PhaE
MDVYKQYMNPAQYKDMMDKYLGFLPENSRQYMQQMSTMMQDSMKQMGMNPEQYQQMRSMMNNMMPSVNGAEMFGGMMNGYNNFTNMMTEAYAPFAKMMPASQHTKNFAEWQDIANRMAVYNIKNAELQYMVYTQGSKAIDKLAENVMQKIQGGEEINSMMALYQEWMNLSDKSFVSLFETDEYSKLMAEVSSMQIKLKKDIELQMEKMFVNIPVATRSEMDEMYKTIYDLKKQVRDLEKMVGSEEDADDSKSGKKSKK